MPFVVSSCWACQDHMTSLQPPLHACAGLPRKNGKESLVCLWGLQMNREHGLRVEPCILLINHTHLTSLLHAAACRTPALGSEAVKVLRLLCRQVFPLQRGARFWSADTLLYCFCFSLLCLSQHKPCSSYSINLMTD
jgi:hypothetical protein